MGTWGFGILDDDVAADIYDDYLKGLNAQQPPETILAAVKERYADELNDPEDAFVVWLAIARAQWDCGQLQPAVLDRVESMIAAGTALNRWKDAGPKAAKRRVKSLQVFVAKLKTKNSRPRKPKKAIKRKPVFSPGDCLAAKMRKGDWAAVLVLEHPQESVDPHEETYGINLFGVLDYRDNTKPTIKIFERRVAFLDVINVFARGFRNAQARFEIVGHVALRPSDQPGDSRLCAYGGWDFADLVHLEHKRAASRRTDRLATEAEEDAKITARRCPKCEKPCPKYRATCKHCGHAIGRTL